MIKIMYLELNYGEVDDCKVNFTCILISESYVGLRWI